jgi:hypothetical protein
MVSYQVSAAHHMVGSRCRELIIDGFLSNYGFEMSFRLLHVPLSPVECMPRQMSVHLQTVCQ